MLITFFAGDKQDKSALSGQVQEYFLTRAGFALMFKAV
jgi:hypothetical protein